MDNIELNSNQIESGKMSFIIRSWNGRTIRQREDGYMSLTDMAQSCGKDYYEWSRLTKTKAYLDALSKKQHTGNARLLIETIKDGDMECRGTWGDRKIAIRFAQWLNTDFAVQVDTWIEELLTKGYVALNDETPKQLTSQERAATVNNLAASLQFFRLGKRLLFL